MESHAAVAQNFGGSATKARTGRKAANMSMLGGQLSCTDVRKESPQAAPFVLEDRSASATP